MRSEGAVVFGRKGSGKSAIFFRSADHFSQDSRNIIVDLRPATHNLSRLREALLDVASAGVYDHTIAAFWQYIIFVEIVLALRERALPKAQNNVQLLQELAEIEEKLRLDEATVSGDFTSRLENVVKLLVDAIEAKGTDRANPAKLTNELFVKVMPELRRSVQSLSGNVKGIYLLIDDLDKGWPARQVADEDVSTIRHLIEVLRKIRNDLLAIDVDFRHFLFLRGDIYEQLVRTTSDRGKYNAVQVDWNDPKQLEFMLRLRVEASVGEAHAHEAWNAIDTKVDGAGSSVSQMIEYSLRRPRFLIELCERVISTAVNRGHVAVTTDDMDEALRQMSLYLVSDFGYEMRDVTGISEDILYTFIGQPEKLSHGAVVALLSDVVSSDEIERAIDTLLWYGVLGVWKSGTPKFIYDLSYDFRRLLAERPRNSGAREYSVNPAFVRGLNG